MNRVKAGDAWARVSTKRYGSRLDGNEARIETLLPSPPPPSPFFLFHVFLLPFYTLLPPASSFNAILSTVLFRGEYNINRAVRCPCAGGTFGILPGRALVPFD